MSQTQYRTHTCNELSEKNIDTEVTLIGWVHHRRDHGGIIFVDLRDAYGMTQITVHPDQAEAYKIVDGVRREYVLQVKGRVQPRPDEMKNEKMETGGIEVSVETAILMSKAKTPPFEINEYVNGVDEELRLKYRYLDLRRRKLHENIAFRHKFIHFTRNYFSNAGFLEIQTPILTKSSPEGARDYLVPSRVHPGKFYALPQAPQQYKQFLMLGGFDKYFQIAPAFRDEEPRADRLPGEFYQLDIEMNFVAQEDVFGALEPYFVAVTEALTTKKVLHKPFRRLTYQDAMSKYGTDRPDLRFGMTIATLNIELQKTEFGVFANALKKEKGTITMLRVPGADKHFSRKDITDLEECAKAKGAGGLAYVQCKPDGSFQSPIWKFFASHEQEAILAKAQELDPDRPIHGSGDILFFGADTWKVACEALGAVRIEVAKRLDTVLPKNERYMKEDEIVYAWVTDFPMFEKDAETQQWDFMHNPFSMPQGGMDALTTKSPAEILAYQYDIVANGFELASGAIRNHEPKTLQKAFEIAGYDQQTFMDRFGHLAGAYEFGAPPHGGIAPGIDRILMILLGEPSIREVVAFPKNGKAEEPMMNSPSEVTPEQLKDVHIRTDIKNKDKQQ